MVTRWMTAETLIVPHSVLAVNAAIRSRPQAGCAERLGEACRHMRLETASRRIRWNIIPIAFRAEHLPCTRFHVAGGRTEGAAAYV